MLLSFVKSLWAGRMKTRERQTACGAGQGIAFSSHQTQTFTSHNTEESELFSGTVEINLITISGVCLFTLHSVIPACPKSATLCFSKRIITVPPLLACEKRNYAVLFLGYLIWWGLYTNSLWGCICDSQYYSVLVKGQETDMECRRVKQGKICEWLNANACEFVLTMVVWYVIWSVRRLVFRSYMKPRKWSCCNYVFAYFASSLIFWKKDFLAFHVCILLGWLWVFICCH